MKTLPQTDLGLVRSVAVWVECGHCKGSGRVPGPDHARYGEIMNCPFCHGRGATPAALSLEELRAMIAEPRAIPEQPPEPTASRSRKTERLSLTDLKDLLRRVTDRSNLYDPLGLGNMSRINQPRVERLLDEVAMALRVLYDDKCLATKKEER